MHNRGGPLSTLEDQMPRPPKSAVDPETGTPLRVLVPSWMKMRAERILRDQRTTLVDWIKAQLRALIADHERDKSPQPPPALTALTGRRKDTKTQTPFTAEPGIERACGEAAELSGSQST